MADAGGWSFTDFGAVGGFGAFILSVFGIVHLRGRKDAAIEAAAKDAKDALHAVAVLEKDLATHKLEVVEKYIPRNQVAALEARFFEHFDRWAKRVDEQFAALNERIDHVISRK